MEPVKRKPRTNRDRYPKPNARVPIRRGTTIALAEVTRIADNGNIFIRVYNPTTDSWQSQKKPIRLGVIVKDAQPPCARPS